MLRQTETLLIDPPEGGVSQTGVAFVLLGAAARCGPGARHPYTAKSPGPETWCEACFSSQSSAVLAWTLEGD
jgi:hypothetical protein